jgi:hypothetical protein
MGEKDKLLQQILAPAVLREPLRESADVMCYRKLALLPSALLAQKGYPKGLDDDRPALEHFDDLQAICIASTRSSTSIAVDDGGRPGCVMPSDSTVCRRHVIANRKEGPNRLGTASDGLEDAGAACLLAAVSVAKCCGRLELPSAPDGSAWRPSRSPGHGGPDSASTQRLNMGQQTASLAPRCLVAVGQHSRMPALYLIPIWPMCEQRNAMFGRQPWP